MVVANRRGKVKDLVRGIETQLNGDAQVGLARCMYGELGQYIEALASECGGAQAEQKFETKSKTVSTLNATLNAGVGGTNADSSGNSLTFSNSTFTSSDGKQVKMGTELGPVGPNEGVLDRRRAFSRRLAQDKEASMDAAEC